MIILGNLFAHFPGVSGSAGSAISRHVTRMRDSDTGQNRSISQTWLCTVTLSGLIRLVHARAETADDGTPQTPHSISPVGVVYNASLWWASWQILHVLHEFLAKCLSKLIKHFGAGLLKNHTIYASDILFFFCHYFDLTVMKAVLQRTLKN